MFPGCIRVVCIQDVCMATLQHASAIGACLQEAFFCNHRASQPADYPKILCLATTMRKCSQNRHAVYIAEQDFWSDMSHKIELQQNGHN